MSVDYAGFFVVKLLWTATLVVLTRGEETCALLQELEFGENGTLFCSFGDDFTTVVWYDSEEHSDSSLIVRYQNNVKSGRGIESGDYDVSFDGSLIITNMSTHHERVFSVLFVGTDGNSTVTKAINASVVATPDQPYPFIDACSKERHCYHRSAQNVNMSCTVRGAKPPFKLKWVETNTRWENDLHYHSMEIIPEGRGLFTTVARVAFGLSDPYPDLTHLVCMPEESQKTITHAEEPFESSVLIESGQTREGYYNLTRVSASSNQSIALVCPKERASIFVWKIIYEESLTTVVAAFRATNGVQVNPGFWEVSEAGVLTIEEVRREHQGLYECTYDTDNYDVATVAYAVSVDATAPIEQDESLAEFLIWIAIFVGIFVAILLLLAMLFFLCRKVCCKPSSKSSKDHYEDYTDPKRYETTAFID